MTSRVVGLRHEKLTAFGYLCAHRMYILRQRPGQLGAMPVCPSFPIEAVEVRFA